jgi:hypothetical protein
MAKVHAALTWLLFFVPWMWAPAALGIDLYISPDGDDTHLGSAEAPLASLTRARDLLREARAGFVRQETATLHLLDGTYTISETFHLASEDSGAAGATVEYRAVHPGRARIRGGKVLASQDFRKVTDPGVMDRMAKEAREAVREFDLGSLGDIDLGSIPDNFRTALPVPELFFGGQRMTLAQWPNEGWAEIDEIVESGPAPWRNHESEALGVFTYQGDHPSRWAGAKEIWLEGYWCFDWAAETIRVEKVDPETRQITLAIQHHYGIGSGNPAPRRYRAVNLLEELDTAGEYFIDRESKRLYFWPPAPLDEAETVLSLLSDPLIKLNDTSHVSFSGLVLEYGAGNGLEITDGTGVLVAGCEVRNLGQLGILVSGGNGHTVRSCDVHHHGTGGLTVSGGDRKTLSPSGHRVENNHIHHVSERMRTAAYNIHLDGVGIRVLHNLISDAPHQAIGVGGNDHLFEFNEVHHVGMASDDCGAFYMGRNPSHRGTVIRHNYWHHIGSDFAHGSCAIYFDDGDGGQRVEGNVFHKASGGSFGAVFNHGGYGNWVDNNLFIECDQAIGSAPWTEKAWRDFLAEPIYKKLFLEDVDITRPPYTEHYPELVGFLEESGRLRLNEASNNVAVRCKNYIEGNWKVGPSVVTQDDPGFVDYETGNFALSEDSEVFDLLPDFKPIPFEKMGLYRDEYRRELP